MFAQQFAQYAQPAAAWGQQQPAGAAWGQPQQQMQQAAPAQPAAAQNKDVTLIVTGCTHATVGGIVRGTFQLQGENHGKPTYKRDGQVNGLDVMTYYWDERDGAGFCGWWFGPKVGGDQVWAYHTDKTAAMPPQTGWKVPYDGPVDPTFVVQYKAKAGAAAAQPAQQSAVWGQQMQQMQQMQQAQAAQYGQQQLGEQQRLAEQRRQLEQLKQKQQEDNQKRAADMRQAQMMTQQQKLQDNKTRLEEANRNRIEEQRKKMEEMKVQQQELIAKRGAEQKRKEEELNAKKLEQIALMNVRRAIQKFKTTPLDKYEENKAILDEAVQKEAANLGSQKDRLTEEITAAVTTTKTRIDQMVQMKKQAQEKAEAENQRRKDLQTKATALVKDLEKLVTKVETSAKGVTEEAEPLTGDQEMKLSAIEACATAAEHAGKEANERVQACSEFVQKESAAIKNCPPIPGETPATCGADLAKLVSRMNVAKATITSTLSKVAGAKATRVKKAHAKDKYEKTLAPFKKFDTDKDGKLSRREIQAFSKSVYTYSLPSDTLDEIFRVLVKDDSKGVEKADFHRLQVMIGIARENSMDAKRKENREKREKMLAKEKEQLKSTFESTAEVIKEASEATSKAEKEAAPLNAAKSTVTAAEMVSQAEAADKVVEAAKESLQTAKDAVGKLSADDTEAELKSFFTGELKKLQNQLAPLEARSTKAAATCTRFRTDATKKNTAELEKLRTAGLAMIWFHQGAKKLSRDDVYKIFDSKKKSKVDENAFVKFFTSCEMQEGTERMSEDDAGRLFGYLDGDDVGHLPKEQFLSLIRRFMKVMKASVLTDDVSTKSKPTRRLIEGEVLEYLAGPQEAEEDIKRLKVKALSDDVEGWVTPVGNRGTVFLEDGGNSFKVVKETIMTSAFVIGGGSKGDKDRKLKVGEVVEAREWPRKEEGSGLMRMKVRVKSDGQIGWATSVGNTGVVFLEVQ